MKLLVSIPFLILIPLSGISIKFATHFCGGNAVATEVSFSGRHATCGMICNEQGDSGTAYFKSYCCEDVQSEYSINNIYISTINFTDIQGNKYISPEFYFQEHFMSYDFHIRPPFESIRPPGIGLSAYGMQPVLCTFRN